MVAKRTDARRTVGLAMDVPDNGQAMQASHGSLLEAFNDPSGGIDVQPARGAPQVHDMSVERIAEADRSLAKDLAAARRQEHPYGRFEKAPAVVSFGDIATVEVDAGIGRGEAGISARDQASHPGRIV
jgi:hypothetical protein